MGFRYWIVTIGTKYVGFLIIKQNPYYQTLGAPNIFPATSQHRLAVTGSAPRRSEADPVARRATRDLDRYMVYMYIHIQYLCIYIYVYHRELVGVCWVRPPSSHWFWLTESPTDGSPSCGLDIWYSSKAWNTVKCQQKHGQTPLVLTALDRSEASGQNCLRATKSCWEQFETHPQQLSCSVWHNCFLGVSSRSSRKWPSEVTSRRTPFPKLDFPRLDFASLFSSLTLENSPKYEACCPVSTGWSYMQSKHPFKHICKHSWVSRKL